jgi:hypothetical protein
MPALDLASFAMALAIIAIGFDVAPEAELEEDLAMNSSAGVEGVGCS